MHGLAEMIRYRALLIAAGYPDGNDCDALKSDPAFKMAVGRLPESGEDLCSQPTISRLENLPGPTALKRMMAAMVELFCDSFDAGAAAHPARYRRHRGPGSRRPATRAVQRPLRQPLLPADPHLRGDDRQAGGDHPAPRQDAGRGRGGAGACAMSSAISAPAGRRSRSSCAATAITAGPRRWRGASASASATSSASPATRCCCARSARSPRTPPSAASPARREKVRRYGDFRYAAKSWNVERRVIARVEAGPQGADSRFIVTNLPGLPKALYEKVYCASGQAENLIKAHKLHLASDRTSCTKATANQFRLLIHTAAYWLMLTLRGLAPRTSFWRDAQFDTIRLCLIKVAGRVTEMVTRIKIALPTAYPLPGRLRRSRRPHRQTAAVTDGAVMPQHKPFGATSNPDHRVSDATKNRARSPPSQRNRQPLMNDPG